MFSSSSWILTVLMLACHGNGTPELRLGLCTIRKHEKRHRKPFICSFVERPQEQEPPPSSSLQFVSPRLFAPPVSLPESKDGYRYQYCTAAHFGSKYDLQRHELLRHSLTRAQWVCSRCSSVTIGHEGTFLEHLERAHGVALDQAAGTVSLKTLAKESFQSAKPPKVANCWICPDGAKHDLLKAEEWEDRWAHFDTHICQTKRSKKSLSHSRSPGSTIDGADRYRGLQNVRTKWSGKDPQVRMVIGNSDGSQLHASSALANHSTDDTKLLAPSSPSAMSLSSGSYRSDSPAASNTATRSGWQARTGADGQDSNTHRIVNALSRDDADRKVGTKTWYCVSLPIREPHRPHRPRNTPSFVHS